MKQNKWYFIIGGIFAAQGIFILAVGIIDGSIPFYALPLFAMAVMSFCMSYLHPHFKQKDERMRMIREKGMFYSYFALLSYFMILMWVLQFDLIQLTAMNLLYIIMALTIMTVFISMAVVAKVN
ncbi:permease [Bacillus haikouensis]|jgi:hypothetical protein|uniref:permease n=1 Tax=Bacillus haikouensis TaxID=1510468 RepID=UPI001557F62E|nr:permease [Bacillus haikouensis]NQD65619.1 permease [Bacillus haikouensis]